MNSNSVVIFAQFNFFLHLLKRKIELKGEMQTLKSNLIFTEIGGNQEFTISAW